MHVYSISYKMHRLSSSHKPWKHYNVNEQYSVNRFSVITIMSQALHLLHNINNSVQTYSWGECTHRSILVSFLLVGETSHPRRRRRKTSEGSSTERGAQRGGEGGQHQSAVKESTTTKTTSSQSTKESVSTRTESTQKASSTAEALHAATDNHTQACTSSAAQVEAGSSEGPVTRGQTSTSEKATEEVQTVHSSAGQVESSADSELHMSTLAMLLTRGNAVAAASGRTVPKIKKKVAPKVVSSRPKRAPRPSAGRTGKTYDMLLPYDLITAALYSG